jgi:hypothetical protein
MPSLWPQDDTGQVPGLLDLPHQARMSPTSDMSRKARVQSKEAHQYGVEGGIVSSRLGQGVLQDPPGLEPRPPQSLKNQSCLPTPDDRQRGQEWRVK